MLPKVIYSIQNKKCYIKFGNSKNFKKRITHNINRYELTLLLGHIFSNKFEDIQIQVICPTVINEHTFKIE